MSPRRTRRGVVKHENSTPDTTKKTKKNVISPKASHSPPKRRRTTRAAKAKPTSDTEENRTRSVTKRSTRKKPIKSDDSLITEDDSFSVNVSSRSVTRRKNITYNSLISDDESPSSKTMTSLTRMNTTPKSSPIAVTLSPHRSKKTPRRSPDNLGSPKTHSDTPAKLLKTPRKLVIKNSPSSSEDSKLNLKSTSPSSRSKPKSPSPKMSSPSKKTPSPKKNSPLVQKKSIKRNTRRTLVTTVKKSISPKVKTPSPKKSPIQIQSPKMNTRRSLNSSSEKKKISPRPVKLSLPVSKIRKSPSKVPVVILEKVNSSMRRSDVSPKSPKILAVKLSPRRSNSMVGNTTINSPKNRSGSVKKIILDSPLANTSSSSSKRGSQKDVRLLLSPTVSLRRSLNLTGSLQESSAMLRKKSSTPKYKSRGSRGIENESEPDLSDTSLINMSDIFESDVSQKEEKDKDGTYELDEPKTPGMKARKAMKRQSPANAKRNEVESKKVRFAESKEDPKVNTAKLRTGTPGHRSSLRRSSEVRSKSKSPQRVTKLMTMSDNQRRRSSSVSVVEGTPRTPANKKIFNSALGSNVKSDHKAQLASVNRLSRPRMSIASEKKNDTKTPVPRKIPNFAEIHKKNFAKMESVVDGKKRVADRHVAMVNPILSSTKSMPEVTIGKRLELRMQNGVYSRFGFKLRKNEAVESMNKKPISMTSEKKINARREILKGVRTNRRFELQMKARKSLGSK